MTNNRINYISFINTVSAVAVVILHANVSFWYYTDKPYWGVANFIETFFYFAVPLFFMLTGATLIDYQNRCSTKTFFKKRFFKTVIPFLAWSVFAMLWASRKTLWAMILGQPNDGLSWTVGSVIDGILNTKFRDIYWFFIPLFCIYLVIPLLGSIPEKKRVKIFTYIIAVSVPLNYVVPFVLSLLSKYADFNMAWTYTVFNGFQYMIYPLIGYVLHKKTLKPKYRAMIYAAAIAGFLAHLLGTYFTSRAQGSVAGLYKGYYNLPCLLHSTGVFLLLKNIAEHITSEKVNRFFGWFQGYTFPIYLIHRYFLDVFEENLNLIHLEKASLIYVVGATVLAIVLSMLTTRLLRFIPGLRRIVP